jgi:transcriptional regulator with XRE-family HTH domain
MIYSNIKKLCFKKKISVSKLESDLNIPRSSICKWDKTTPSVLKVKSVADYFGVSMEELLSDTGD